MPSKHKIFAKHLYNVVGPTLYKCYANALCFLGGAGYKRRWWVRRTSHSHSLTTMNFLRSALTPVLLLAMTAILAPEPATGKWNVVLSKTRVNQSVIWHNCIGFASKSGFRRSFFRRFISYLGFIFILLDTCITGAYHIESQTYEIHTCLSIS